MSSVPRWFLIASSLLALNLVLVFTSAVWRHAGADEPPFQSTTTKHASDAAEGQQGEASELSAQAAADPLPAAPQDSENPLTDATGPLDALPIPDQLPRSAMPTDPQSLASDPVFSELRRLFSEQSSASDNEPTLDPPLQFSPAKMPANQDGMALAERLKTVELLCTAARRIATEAAEMTQAGEAQSAQAMLQMAQQLRDMSAQLLSSSW
jgi:hypothetical protein